MIEKKIPNNKLKRMIRIKLEFELDFGTGEVFWLIKLLLTTFGKEGSFGLKEALK